MRIRKAKLEEIEQIEEIYKTLFAKMARLQPDCYKAAEQDREFLREMIQSEEAGFLVAQQEEQLVGFALVQAQRTPPYSCMVPRTFAFLTDLAVLPSFQGQGIGTQLLHAVEQWAETKGLKEIELNVLCQNTQAAQLYEKEGFAASSVTMRKKI